MITMWWNMWCNKVLYFDIIAIWDYMCVWTSRAHIYEHLVLLCKIGCDNHAPPRRPHRLVSKRTPEPPQHTGDPPLPSPPLQVQWTHICFHLQGIHPIYKSTYPHREHILLLGLQRHVNTTRRLAQWWRWSIPWSRYQVRLPGIMVFLWVWIY